MSILIIHIHCFMFSVSCEGMYLELQEKLNFSIKLSSFSSCSLRYELCLSPFGIFPQLIHTFGFDSLTADAFPDTTLYFIWAADRHRDPDRRLSVAAYVGSSLKGLFKKEAERVRMIHVAANPQV